jgi:hypothetical protein
MTEAEKCGALAKDMRKLIGRYAEEFDMALASAIGVLEVVKVEMVTAVQTDDDED